MTSSAAPHPDPGLRLSGLIDDALTVEFDVTNEPGSLALAAEAAPIILELVRRAEDCLAAIQDHYEGVLEREEAIPAAADPGSLDDIGAMISSEVAAQEVLDLAFIALAQLRLASGRLETAIHRQNLLAIVTRADSALTRLRRETIPLEAAIADFEGREAPMRRWIDLEVSLEIRRLYGSLRRAVNAVGDPDDRTVAQVLEEFAARLAGLAKDPIYPRLRVSDRVQLQTLSRRIAAWLASGSDRDPVVGRRIWSDLATWCQLLAAVSNRQELVEHDRQVIARAYHALYASVRRPSLIPIDLLEDLATLEGRDDELDTLLQSGTSRRPEDWRSVITRLHEGGTGSAEAVEFR